MAAIAGSIGASIGATAAGTFGWTAATWSQIGWVAGVLISNYLLAPDGPEVINTGPRLNDLKVTTSTYGMDIPKVFGSYRIAGNIIWALPLQETRHEETEEEGKGGGGGSTTTIWYTYAASFAIALCEGPISGIRKIWLGSKLVYDLSNDGSYNDFYQSGKLNDHVTIYNGSSSQAINTTIQSDKADTPAYRHTAYIVFNDLQLKDYGNIIPNVTCEVVKSGSTSSSMLVNSNYLPNFVVDWNIITNYVNNYMYTFVGLWDNGYSTHNFDVYKSIDSAENATLYKNIIVNTDNNNNLMWDNNLETSTDTIKNVTSVFSKEPAYILYWSDDDYYRFYVYNEDGLMSPSYSSSYPDPYYDDEMYPGGPGYILDKSIGYNESHTRAFVKSYSDIFLTRNHTDCYIMRISGSQFYDVIDPTLLTDVYETFVGDNEIYTLNRSANLRLIQIKIYDFNGNLLNTLDIETDGDIWRDLSSADFFSRLFSSEDGQLYVIGATDMDLHLINTNTGSYTFFKNTLPNGDIIEEAYKYGGYTIKSGIFNQYFPSLNTAVEKHQIITYNALASNSILLNTIVEELELESGLTDSDINNTEGAETNVTGYVVTKNMTARAAIEPLLSAYEYDLIELGFKVVLRKRNKDAVEDIPAEYLGANIDYNIEYNVTQEIDLIKSLTIKYANPDSDYQIGVQQARRIDTKATNEIITELPLAFTDDEAKQLVEKTLYRNWLERQRLKFNLPIIYRDLIVSDVINIEFDNFIKNVRLTKLTITSDNVIECEALANSYDIFISDSTGTNTGGNGGTISEDIGDTLFKVLNIPTLYNEYISTEGMYIAVSGVLGGWSGCTLLSKSTNADDLTLDATVLGGTGIGLANNVLSDHTTNTWDITNSVTVSSTVELFERDDLITNGSNYILLGNEILQYATVVDTGNNIYTLSKLLRGRRGTEWATGTHSTGEVFVFLDQNAFAFNTSSIGSNKYYTAISLNTTVVEPIIQKYNTGTNLKPFSPAYVRYIRQNIEDIYVTWMRRSRYIRGRFQTLPLSETIEDYNIDIYYLGEFLINYTTNDPNFTYTGTQQELDGVVTAGDRLELYISQISEIYGNGETTYLDVADIDITKENMITYFKLNEYNLSDNLIMAEEISNLDGEFLTTSAPFVSSAPLVNIGGFSPQFSHNGSKRVDCNNSNIYSIATTGELGISLFFNVASKYSTRFLISKAATNKNEWKIFFNDGVTNHLNIGLYTVSGTEIKRIKLDSTGFVLGSTIYHLVVNFTGSTYSDDILVYVNGIKQTYTTITSSNTYTNNGSTATMQIGGGGVNAASGSQFDGQIDDVRIYNKVIPKTQRDALYAMKA